MESSTTAEKTKAISGFTDAEMALSAVKLSAMESQDVVKKYQINSQDTGSPEVQVAMLTKKIEELTKHGF